ncbi:MAG TPA: glycoside hydrolase family 13 protein [Verrucomicrobiae bacterium]|nr:glycoside hydrolase family 13 protein [Verrucomicrobiae bacterium]
MRKLILLLALLVPLGLFAQTKSQPQFATPDWAKNVVWYQIFPERFRNGTPLNDPPRTLRWRWDWYKFAPWETPNDAKSFSRDWGSRRFGGDLQGITAELPYFHQLGVTALYFNPLFESGSNHGYDTIDYRHISEFFGVKGDYSELAGKETLDPKTWQWTPSDKLFLEFVKRAHAQGVKVIIDGVFNHMGRNSFALQDVLTNGVKSVYADWFEVTDWGPPVKYKSWDGGGAMPIFRKDPVKGYASSTAKKYIFDVTRRWMDPDGDGDPSDGVDGWRLDVAQDVPKPFWVAWRKLVKKINPNAYITGEIWDMATQYLRGDEWDAVMNYPFVFRATHFFIDQKRKITATEFDRQLRELLASYPLQVDEVMQNLYDSHDTDRLVSMIANPDRGYDHSNRPDRDCPYDGHKPGPEAYRVMKLMATFQMTFVGAPMIYYGDEAGMFGADDPIDRKPMLWSDLQPYDNPQDAVMNAVWSHYARVIAIRNTYPALRTGLYQTLLTDDANDVFAFTRTLGKDIVAVVINDSVKDQTVEVPSPFPNDARVSDLESAPAEFYDAPMTSIGFPQFSKNAMVLAIRVKPDVPVLIVRSGKLRLNLAHKSAAILVRP